MSKLLNTFGEVKEFKLETDPDNNLLCYCLYKTEACVNKAMAALQSLRIKDCTLSLKRLPKSQATAIFPSS